MAPCISLLAVTGVGIGTDYSEIIKLFRTLSSDKAFSMNGWIELSFMSALNGANLSGLCSSSIYFLIFSIMP